MVGLNIPVSADSNYARTRVLAYLCPDLKEWAQTWNLFSPGVVLAM